MKSFAAFALFAVASLANEDAERARILSEIEALKGQLQQQRTIIQQQFLQLANLEEDEARRLQTVGNVTATAWATEKAALDATDGEHGGGHGHSLALLVRCSSHVQPSCEYRLGSDPSVAADPAWMGPGGRPNSKYHHGSDASGSHRYHRDVWQSHEKSTASKPNVSQGHPAGAWCQDATTIARPKAWETTEAEKAT